MLVPCFHDNSESVTTKLKRGSVFFVSVNMHAENNIIATKNSINRSPDGIPFDRENDYFYTF